METNPLLGIKTVEVIRAEILEWLVVAQYVVDGHQQAVLDRADGALFPTPSRQPMILRFEIAVLFAYRRMGHLGQHGVQMTVGRRGFATFAFAGALVVARALPRPRGKMFVSREPSHVRTGFGQKRLGAALGHPADRIKLLDCRYKRAGRYLIDPLRHDLDLLVDKIVLHEQLAQHEPMMITELSRQRAAQLGNLVAQLLLRQLGQYAWVFLAADQRLDHLASRDSQHITGHRAQLDVGALQYFLYPIVDRVSLL